MKDVKLTNQLFYGELQRVQPEKRCKDAIKTLERFVSQLKTLSRCKIGQFEKNYLRLL